VDFDVVGRGEDSSKHFFKMIGKQPTIGGIESFFSKATQGLYSKAIVAVGERQLGIATAQAIQHNIPEILVEKPGAYNFEDMKNILNTLSIYY
jgi:hypothetical protein